MSSEARDDEIVAAIVTPMLVRLGPRSPGMGNPPCYLWEIASAKGVAIVMAHVAVKALRSLPVEQRMEAMGMEPIDGPSFGPARYVERDFEETS